jgi:hypothetical protein
LPPMWWSSRTSRDRAGSAAHRDIAWPSRRQDCADRATGDRRREAGSSRVSSWPIFSWPTAAPAWMPSTRSCARSRCPSFLSRPTAAVADRYRPEPTFLITKPFHPDSIKAIVSQACSSTFAAGPSHFVRPPESLRNSAPLEQGAPASCRRFPNCSESSSLGAT